MQKIILVILVFWCSQFYGQEKAKKIEHLIDCYANALNNNPDSALIYITKATKECRKIKNDFLLARCLYNQGNFFYLKNNIDQATQLVNESLLYAKAANNFKIQALANNQLGLIEMDKSEYNASLKKFLKALDIAQKNKLSNKECLIINNLGLLFELQKDTLKALAFYEQNEKIALENDFKDVLLITYNNLATLKKHSDKNFAITYLLKAKKVAFDLEDENEAFNILINLSAVYLSVGGTKKINQAFQCLQQAKQMAVKAKNTNQLFYVYFNLGGYYAVLKNYENAIMHYKKAMLVLKKGLNEDQTIKLYEAIASAYKNNKNYEEAYFFKEKYHTTKDSLFNLEKNKAFNEIQTKYEVGKKNLKIKLLTQQKAIERNKKQLFLILGFILLGTIVFLFVFFKQRIKTQMTIQENENKIYQQEKLKLQQEQELKRVLGVLEGKDKERNRIAKDIHDGIGGKLAALKLQLVQINAKMKSSKIEKIVDYLSEVFQELRIISHDLSNHYIKNATLSDLMLELLEHYKKRNEFEFELIVYPENSLNNLSFEIKHNLYRIIQELLTNVSKHANARNVLVSFTQHEDFLNIIIEDNGVGFSDKEKVGIGLKNIEERLFSINGSLAIETTKNEGTTLIINTPNQKND